ncbi:MAG TPA: DUF3368 domain-containing protein [Syntrophothermus lipocalidus]|uniref:Nucleic acid-binding protein n=1 Tax=Syntrophothermus lipocalidus (strain DSM 12680 / TGB-C1) TaxID=643648 RepID=D7CMW5_SYNLT|nr:DUF3368 domain-containing protein [Syntrophothermus lipocalidus]ADI02050.1 nucleic acid-binding protein [Syntrophothermus lipocalidus DSM 12680]HHV76546.1 DUF3368 domain-containing protein [Syntrophothermus lipocalidus]HOV43472.1 DUF3368 domain-containing protein [Syntrophothermus lipocalidus]
MKVVSNSTPLIALARIKQVELLHHLFGRIMIPQCVYNEVVLPGTELPGVKEIGEATWIETLQVQNALAVSLLKTDLDGGEAEAIVLAKEVNADYLLVDEKKARRIARNSGLRIMGTLGILVLGVKRELLPAIDPILDSLEQNGFRFSEKVRTKIRKEIGK